MADSETSELAVAYMSLLPSMRRFEPAVMDGIRGLGTRVGKQFAADWAQAVNREVQTGLKQMTTEVEAAAKSQAAAVDRIRKAEDELARARKSGSGDIDRAVKAERELAAAKADNGRSSDLAAKATDRLARSEKEAGSAADKAATGIKSVSDAAKDATSDIRKLSDTEVDPDVSKVKSNFSGAFGGISGLLTKAGPGIVAAGAAIGIGAGVAFASAFGEAMGRDVSKQKLGAQLGLNPAETARAGKLAGGIYADNYGESFDQVNEAIKSVTNSVGFFGMMSDKELTSVTKSVLDIATAFDKDVNEVTRAAGQMVRTGMAKDFTAAMDILTKGFQGPADKADDMLDTFNEYSTQFRKMGLDGKDALGLINQMVRAGARDSDIAADAIKEFSVRTQESLYVVDKQGRTQFTALGEALKESLNIEGTDAQVAKQLMGVQSALAKGGPKARDLFSKITEGMKGIKEPADRSAAAVALFGTQAEDLGDALFAMDLAQAASDMRNLDGTTKKMGDTLNDTAQGRIDTFTRKLKSGMVDFIGDEVIPGLNTFIDTISKVNPEDITKAITAQANKEDDPLRLNRAVETVRSFQTELGPIVADFKAMFGDLIPELSPEALAIWDELKGIVGQVLDSIMDRVNMFVAIASFIWRHWGDDIISVARGWIRMVVKIIRGGLEIVSGVIRLFTSLAKGDWSGAFDALKKIVRGFARIFSAQFEYIRDTVFPLLGKALGWGIGKLRGFASYLGGVFRRTLARVRQWIMSPIDSAMKGISGSLRDGRGKFREFTDFAKKHLGRLEGAAKKPIDFVVNTVLNKGLIPGFNWVAKLLPGVDEIGTIPWPPRGWARGGILPGFNPVSRGDDVLTPMRSGEGVSVSEAMTDPYERSRLVKMNEYVLAGGTPANFRRMLGEGGYAKGGIVWPTNTKQLSGNYAGHSGVDIAAAGGAPIYATQAGKIAYTGWGRGYGQAIFEQFANGLQMVYGHTSAVKTNAGAAVTAGQLIGLVGSTGRSTGNHLHVEINSPGAFGSAANRAATLRYLGGASVPAGGGSSGDSGISFDPLGEFLKRITGPLAQIDGIKDGPFGELAAGVPKAAIAGMKEKVAGFAGDLGAVGKTAAASAWAPVLTAALKMNGLPLSQLDNWVRQVASESGGNPNAVQGNIGDVNNASGDLAKGLLQVIGATFQAYRSRILPNNVFNPLSNAYAAMNYAKHRYPNIEAVIGHGHGYIGGTDNALPGAAWLSEDGRPELVVGKQVANLNAGSRVLNAADTARALAGPSPDDMYIAMRRALSGARLRLDGAGEFVEMKIAQDGAHGDRMARVGVS